MNKSFITKLCMFGVVLAIEAAVGGAALGIFSASQNTGHSTNTNNDTPGGDEEPPVEEEEVLNPIHISAVSYKFECEDMRLLGAAQAGEQRGANTNNPSGGSFVGELNNNIGAGVTFKFKSDLDTVAKFVVCIGRRSDKTIDFKQSFALTLNDYPQTLRSVVTTKCDSSTNYFGWSEYTVAYINVKKGVNELEFVTKGTISSNIDYFRLDTYGTLSIPKGE